MTVLYEMVCVQSGGRKQMGALRCRGQLGSRVLKFKCGLETNKSRLNVSEEIFEAGEISEERNVSDQSERL